MRIILIPVTGSVLYEAFYVPNISADKDYLEIILDGKATTKLVPGLF
jgi:uncharacterized protein YqhQ